MGRGAASCRVMRAARGLPWRGNGRVPGVRPQEAAFDREANGTGVRLKTRRFLRSAVVVAIASLSFEARLPGEERTTFRSNG